MKADKTCGTSDQKLHIFPPGCGYPVLHNGRFYTGLRLGSLALQLQDVSCSGAILVNYYLMQMIFIYKMLIEYTYGLSMNVAVALQIPGTLV
ncbi:hypothetical protein FRA07_29765 [Klebsiella quasipneumoniae subsp. similipneumoniae]|nr:hypothetical protein FRA07_29765 [Klebsiella quasipneumoniae subsp. similipneumoniae]